MVSVLDNQHTTMGKEHEMLFVMKDVKRHIQDAMDMCDPDTIGDELANAIASAYMGAEKAIEIMERENIGAERAVHYDEDEFEEADESSWHEKYHVQLYDSLCPGEGVLLQYRMFDDYRKATTWADEQIRYGHALSADIRSVKECNVLTGTTIMTVPNINM